MKKSYQEQWINGKRQSDKQYTQYQPRGLKSSTSGNSLEQTLLETTKPPIVNKDVSTQLVFLQGKSKGFLYNIPSGEEINGDFPMLQSDPMNGLAWCVQDGKNNTVHVTKGELSRSQGLYSEIANRIAGRMGGECIGSYTYPDFLKRCKMYNKTVNSFIDWPRDNKVFHTLDGKKSLTPEQMSSMLPALFWVRVGGKTDHRIHLIVPDDLPLRKEWNDYIRSRNPEYTGTPIWTFGRACDYYLEHKDEEQSLFSRMKNWASRHKSALAMAGIVTGLTAAGLGLYNNRESIGESLSQLGVRASNLAEATATGAKNLAGKAKELNLGEKAKDLYNMGHDFLYGPETIATKWMDEIKKSREPRFIKRDQDNIKNNKNIIDMMNDLTYKLHIIIDPTSLQSNFIGSIIQTMIPNGKFDEQRLYQIPNLSFSQVRKLLDMLFPEYTFTDRFFARVFCASSWWCLTSKQTKGFGLDDIVKGAKAVGTAIHDIFVPGSKEAREEADAMVNGGQEPEFEAPPTPSETSETKSETPSEAKKGYTPVCSNNAVLFTWYPKNTDNNWKLFKPYLKAIRKYFKLDEKCVYMDEEFLWGDHPSPKFLEKREAELRAMYSFGGRMYNLVDQYAGKEIADLLQTGKETIYNNAKAKLVERNNDALYRLSDKDTYLRKKRLEDELAIKNMENEMKVQGMKNKKSLSDTNADLQKSRMKNWSDIAMTGLDSTSRILQGGTKLAAAYNGLPIMDFGRSAKKEEPEPETKKESSVPDNRDRHRYRTFTVYDDGTPVYQQSDAKDPFDDTVPVEDKEAHRKLAEEIARQLKEQGFTEEQIRELIAKAGAEK